MARIRSIHPGFFTDERWVSVSPLARLLGIGIWTECDDQGAFEWKPLQMKMRLFAADSVDVAPLLEELAAADLVRSYEHEGRKFGAVRNFRRFQRPKKPNCIHFMPPEFRTYVGLSGPSSEPDEDQGGGGSEPDAVKGMPVPKRGEPEVVKAASVPQKGELAKQMEDGEGEGVGEEITTNVFPYDGADAPAAGKAYAFAGRVIRLNAADLAGWKARFHGIPDVEAELTSIDAWLCTQPDAKRKGWFHAVAGMLNRRHQERLAEQKAQATPAKTTIPVELPKQRGIYQTPEWAM